MMQSLLSIDSNTTLVKVKFSGASSVAGGIAFKYNTC